MREPRSASPTDARWEDLARTASIGQQGADEADLLLEFLSFEVGETAYAVPIERVREILRLRPITPVPRVPEIVLGVISIRGEVVEVIDLRRRFGLSPAVPDRRTRIIVIHGFDGRVTGCMVDRVREVMRVREEEILLAPEAGADTVSGLCKRADEFVSVLDLDKVMDIES